MSKRRLFTIITFMVTALILSMTVSFAESKTDISLKYEINKSAEHQVNFILEGIDSAPMPEGSNENLKRIDRKAESGEVDFGEVSFNRPDLYTYKIYRESSNIENITEDLTRYELYILVLSDGSVKKVVMNKDDQSKPLEILYKDHVSESPAKEPDKPVDEEGGKDEEKHDEDAEMPDELLPCFDDPPVAKVVTGTKKKDTFKFKMTAVSTTNKVIPMPSDDNKYIEGKVGDKKIMNVTAGEEKEFGRVYFYQEGTYVYEIAEVNDKKDGYKYDGSIYKITYVITKSRNKLVKNKTVTKDGKKVRSAYYTYVNEYKADKEKEITPERKPEKPVSSPRKTKLFGVIPVKTGDANKIYLFIIIGVAASGLLYAVVKSKNNNSNKTKIKDF